MEGTVSGTRERLQRGASRASHGRDETTGEVKRERPDQPGRDNGGYDLTGRVKGAVDVSGEEPVEEEPWGGGREQKGVG